MLKLFAVMTGDKLNLQKENNAMTYKEYKRILDHELYHVVPYGNGSLLSRLRIKYLQPNTNCVYLCRKMWFLYSRGKLGKIRAKFLYLKILRKFGCIIYPSAIVDEGFHVAHPVGIVIGDCQIGKNFTIFQGCTIGTGNPNPNDGRVSPIIGDNVNLAANSVVVGGVTIADNCIIGASTTVVRDLSVSGTYVGSPARLLDKKTK